MQPFRALLDQPVHELTLKLTLITLMIFGYNHKWLEIPVTLLCGFALVSGHMLKNKCFWCVLCAIIWSVNFVDRYWIDNHKYLLCYWVLACTLSCFAKDQASILKSNGRVLIGLCFLFATIWKFAGGQYLDGEFLYFTMLADERMHEIPIALAGVTQAEAKLIATEIQQLGIFAQETIQIDFPTNPVLQTIAFAMSWWTIVIEAVIAILFLAPLSKRFTIGRDWLLFGFMATYLIVPVSGFAYELLVMGFACCAAERRKTRAIYLLLFVLVRCVPFFVQKGLIALGRM